MRAIGRTFAVSGALVVGASTILAANAVSASGHGATTPTASTSAPAAPAPMSKGWKIANAMSAAPRSLSHDATIMDYPAKPDGDLVLLRKGTNAWTCLPDDSNTPGNDPICFDKGSQQWFEAWIAHKTPKLGTPGIAYMLRGASDASNTDPYKMKPAEGEDWIHAGPHVMFFPTKQLAKGSYTTDPDNGGPWVMWAGSPYAHFMVPTTSGGHEAPFAMGGMGGMGGGGH